MRLLALETSTAACSAALMIDNDIVSRFEITRHGHSDLILDMFEEVLADGGINRTQLDALAFGRGPGSFTGVRIAASVAQGVAYALEIPVVAVSSLAALAQQAFRETGHEHLYAAIDARMNEVYCAFYTVTDTGFVAEECEERVCSAEESPVPFGSDYFGCGSGWRAYSNSLKARLSPMVCRFAAEHHPHAGAVVQLGRRELMKGRQLSPEQAIPSYLRDRVAEKSKA